MIDTGIDQSGVRKCRKTEKATRASCYPCESDGANAGDAGHGSTLRGGPEEAEEAALAALG